MFCSDENDFNRSYVNLRCIDINTNLGVKYKERQYKDTYSKRKTKIHST